MRYLQLDFLRGFAIILMIIFHASFDLNYFHFIDIDIYRAAFWLNFRIVIVSLFLLCVGISLFLANKNGLNFKKNFKRFSTLLLLSLLITLVTFFIFEKSWIYFGVLHFIAFASLIGVFFIRFTWLNLFLGVSIILLYMLKLINMHWLYNATHTLLHLPKYTEDLVPFIPWFGVVLIGVFVGKKALYMFPLPTNTVTQGIAYLGKHALFIYILHQPILFGFAAGADFLLHRG